MKLSRIGAIVSSWRSPPPRWLDGTGPDDVIRAEMTRRNIPGLSLAVVKDGTIVKASAYGIADRAGEAARDPSAGSGSP
jgi:CubicO group peptidase (beta-lactamase class C family)